MIVAYQGLLKLWASWTPDAVAMAKPRVSIINSVLPIFVTRRTLSVIATAATILPITHGSVIKIGLRPRKILRRVPPETDATIATSAMPP